VTVYALTTGHKLGLGLVALVWIVFSLTVSMIVPRFRPGFPGKSLPAFLALVTLFFVAMLTAVFVFGKEAKKSAASSAPPAQTSTPAAPSATPAQLADGKKVFAKVSCGGCHTLKDANAHGTVGPNLDQLKPDAAKVAHQVENGGAAMPAFKGVLTPQQITDVAAYVATVAGK
jgi:mono/diheme cytochrome c family protein